MDQTGPKPTGARLLIVALLALGAGVATGESRVHEGQGVVEARDVATGTLEMNLQTYEVSRVTVLEGLEGEPITLADVPVRDDPRYTGGQLEPGAVEFRAVQRGDRWRLLRLRLIPAIPK